MANKLYFDVSIGSAQTNRSFLCTKFTAGSPGDRYGSLFDPVESCTASTPLAIKRSRAVGAWFVPTMVAGQNATTALNLAFFAVKFVQPTVPGANQTLARLPYPNVDANWRGTEAIYGTAGVLRNFSVQIQKNKAAGGTITVTGVLYVQKQHSIEV